MHKYKGHTQKGHTQKVTSLATSTQSGWLTCPSQLAYGPLEYAIHLLCEREYCTTVSAANTDPRPQSAIHLLCAIAEIPLGCGPLFGNPSSATLILAQNLSSRDAQAA
jgi:hypothetical protein